VVKRKRSVFVPGIGGVPRSAIFPASARGKYRKSGNYGRFGTQATGGARPEMKFIDNVMAYGTVANTGTLRPTAATDAVTPAVAVAATGTLLQVVQGDQTYQRNGRKITIRKISCRLKVLLAGDISAATTRDIYRLILVLDTQCNGAAPAVTDVISYPGQTLSTESFNNLENSERFRVLFDVYRAINATAGGIGANAADKNSGDVIHLIKYNNSRLNIPVEYSTTATTGALATIKSNNLFLLTISESGLIDLAGNVRIRYTDS